LLPALSSLAACPMTPKPCAQLDFAAIITDISRPINHVGRQTINDLAAKQLLAPTGRSAYTGGGKLLHWRSEILAPTAAFPPYLCAGFVRGLRGRWRDGTVGKAPFPGPTRLAGQGFFSQTPGWKRSSLPNENMPYARKTCLCS
jgi:hypothetical protein